jgi:hypothetical protein
MGPLLVSIETKFIPIKRMRRATYVAHTRDQIIYLANLKKEATWENNIRIHVEDIRCKVAASSASEMGPVPGSCEHRNETSETIKPVTS